MQEREHIFRLAEMFVILAAASAVTGALFLNAAVMKEDTIGSYIIKYHETSSESLRARLSSAVETATSSTIPTMNLTTNILFGAGGVFLICSFVFWFIAKRKPHQRKLIV